MTQVQIAVDCGGTSSKALLRVDGESAARAQFTNAATLSGYLDPGLIGATMRQILEPIEEACGAGGLRGLPVRVVIAAAGFVDSLRTTFREAAEAAVSTMFDGAVSEILVVNDGVALILGHQADGAVIAGTGSNVLIRSGATVAQHGGHDWVASDDGSGFWVGLDGIRAVARDLEQGIQSPLRQQFRETYRVTDAEVQAQFRSLAVAGPTMKADIARFAGSVCAVAAGDETARAIIDEQAGTLARLVDRGVRQSDITGTARMVLCGGLMGNPLYRKAFTDKVDDGLGDADLEVHWVTVRDGLPAVSAIAAGRRSWKRLDLGERAPLVVTGSRD
ncbi:BadF/BadG/BcrA/BcrD ATPase family protein [Gordonia sp. (in: high G+C Gram-positive bacteria)]|uniref:BadF/BadG/BcrA/BcrD ATPase family protein n=1 Tax=Gordonia sp. (in: high G+C Gram-positive bacteria) TaxID=84139 RepID=UPI003C78E3EC